MDHFEIPGTVRVSLAFYNTKKEIDKLYNSLKQVISMLS
jgi:cysteine desulfurase/selenocysteine lyase